MRKYNFSGLVVLATKLRVIINSGITSLALIPESLKLLIELLCLHTQ